MKVAKLTLNSLVALVASSALFFLASCDQASEEAAAPEAPAPEKVAEAPKPEAPKPEAPKPEAPKPVEKKPEPPKPAAPKGVKIVIKGSDTLGAKMVPQLAEAYKAAGNGNVTFEIAAEGSSTAFTTLLAGTADIGMSSRDVKEEEKLKFVSAGMKLSEHVAGIDMIAVIVNQNSAVAGLEKAQVEAIFTGDAANWSEVGAADAPISAYTRNTSSGTYKTFQGLAMNKRDYGADTQKMAGNEQIAQEVGKNPNGIGYVGLAYTSADGIKAIQVDGIEPVPANQATYPLSRKLYYYTIDGKLSPGAKKFLKWATTSPKAKEIVAKVGFIAYEG